MTMQRVWLGAVCSGLVVALSGCPNPNMYTTPRTIDPGKIQWQVAPEVIGVNYNSKTVDPVTGATIKTGVSGVLPMVPSFGARIGVADGFDIGVRLQNLDSLAADFKIRLLKSRFDIALDPGLQGYYVSINSTGLGVVYFHVPVLLGLNLTDKVSLVLSPGFVYSVASATVDNGSGVSGAASATGAMGRLGFGADFRIGEKFAIHPEVTFMQQFGDLNALIWVGGIGLNFGAQPDYSDLAEGPTPPTGAPPAGAAPAGAPPAAAPPAGQHTL